jgi:uncharacterized membrane protein
MAFNIFDEVQKRSKGQWQSLAREQIYRARTWIQENGEASFLIGALSGFILVAFSKTVLILFTIALIVVGGLYMLAPEETSEILQRDDASTTGEQEVTSDASPEVEASKVDTSGEETKIH